MKKLEEAKIEMNSQYGKTEYVDTDSAYPAAMIEETAPVDPVRIAIIESADPARIKKRVLAALNIIKGYISEGKLISESSWDVLLETSDLYYDVLAFREKEKKDAEIAKAAKAEVAELQKTVADK